MSDGHGCIVPTASNGIGRLTTASDASGQTTFSYDKMGRTTSSSTTIDGTVYTVQTAYDDLGRMTSLTYPDNEVVSYRYDNGGNLYNVVGYTTLSNFNALGQAGQIAFQNGATTTLAYYPLNNRLQEMTTTAPVDGPVQHLSYGYDAVGNVTSISDLLNSDNTQNFLYDGLNRLSTATSPSYSTISLTYDEIGNITYNSRVGSYAYNGSQPHGATAAGSNSYAYDANGNMSSKNGAAMTYDYENRLRTVMSGSVTTSFVYNYAGARVKKTTDVPASTTIYIGNLFEIKDGVATKHIFAGGKRIASKSGTHVYYYHPDHLGGLNIVTDETGAKKQATAYYPFGETRTNSGSMNLPYKFTGQENDPESGLYYYGARYYDPVLGKFTSPDSIVQAAGDPQTLNRYAYCRNNPLLYTDPTGHFWWLGFAIALVLGAGAGAAISAIQGGDIGMGALTGAISAGAFFAVGEGLLALNLVTQAGAYTSNAAFAASVGIHAATGAAVGAVNAAITGGDVGMAALTGGISGGIGKFAGNYIPHLDDKFANYGLQLGGRSAIGGISGGISAELYGGSFGQGFGQGAWTAGFGTAFNDFGVITGTLLCTALSFGIAWVGTRIASWSMGNPSAAPIEFDPDTPFAKNYRVSDVTSELTTAAGALTVSAEALVLGGTYSAYLYPEFAIAGTEFTRGALSSPNPFTRWTTAGRGARLLYEWWK